ncbi:hypothetical protein [Streptomyces sp. NPDC088752]|uniref:hypothetical protein n=1 Tax=Streptomyces sp. NPDC088752 TaxID=3154963 RepID=UPI003438C5AD
MDTEPGSDRRERGVDWLASHPDLPHLIAHLSELVHVHGYAPEDLVVLPRPEVDRRETTAFTAGWAEAVSDELPRIRREYEKRVADAYAQGQGDARGIRRPLRRTDDGREGARIIALPFARLLEPPAAVADAEERLRRERETFGRRAEPEPEHRTEPEPARWGMDEPKQRVRPEREHRAASEPASREVGEPEAGDIGVSESRAATRRDSEPEVPPTAEESRTRRNVQPVRRVARRKDGRPIVPPLAHVPTQTGSSADRREPESGEPESRAGRGRRLSERAKALEEDMVSERTREAPPEPPS